MHRLARTVLSAATVSACTQDADIGLTSVPIMCQPEPAGDVAGALRNEAGDHEFQFVTASLLAQPMTARLEDPNGQLTLDLGFPCGSPGLEVFDVVALSGEQVFVIDSDLEAEAFYTLCAAGRSDITVLSDLRYNFVYVAVVAKLISLGNGEEILGFGYQMQLTGARAAIASLWSVSDGGTQVLMDAFYGVLHKGNITKTETLRQAQISLITSNYTGLGRQRGIVTAQPTRNIPNTVSDRLSHPYYWAPFILIGNGF